MRTSRFLRLENQAEINNKLTDLKGYCLPVTTFTSASIQRKQVSEGLRYRHTLLCLTRTHSCFRDPAVQIVITLLIPL